MKKEEIRIRVTPDNVKEFIEVLSRNGEKFFLPSDMFKGADIDPENFMNEYTGFRTIARFGWTEHWQITCVNEWGTELNWTPQDLDEYLLTKDQRVVKNADGTASSVTLRDDKAVVEMPNGTLRIVDKSNLLTLRHEKDDLREEDR